MDAIGNHKSLKPAGALAHPTPRPAICLFICHGWDQFGNIAVAGKAHAEIGDRARMFGWCTPGSFIDLPVLADCRDRGDTACVARILQDVERQIDSCDGYAAPAAGDVAAARSGITASNMRPDTGDACSRSAGA